VESFALAQSYTQPGQLIEMRDVFLSQACRATKALATLANTTAPSPQGHLQGHRRLRRF
jgi:hypothetical protein